jgi:hypothetical protein
MPVEITTYQGRAKTHWNYIAWADDKIVAANIGYATGADAIAAAKAATTWITKTQYRFTDALLSNAIAAGLAETPIGDHADADGK